MAAGSGLVAELQKQVLLLEDDLRERVEADAEVRAAWQAEYAEALGRGRTAAAWQPWRDDRITQAAVGWVLTTVFLRFAEDNALVQPVWISGPEARRQEALDAELAFYRERSRAGDVTSREWLLAAVAHLRALPATAALVDAHAALHLVAPSGDAVAALLAFWRARGDDGRLVHDLADPTLSTRFLGDLYQDLSQHAKDTYALLQTPEFVEKFILDRTLEPALRERPLDGFRMIDPACGSGHFLLGAFARLLDRWDRAAPALEVQARVQLALNAVHGVDLNPFAVAIARFRLTLAALQASGLVSLEDAPAFHFHLAVGDSLLHGDPQLTLDGLDADAGLSGFTYATEDLALLREILQPARYDVVVGNPPYISVKDSGLRDAYRKRYPKVCSGKYVLTVPFMARFFDLAKRAGEGRPAGWTGQITSNSFMKREFGAKLIEGFLARQDLRLVADTSGAYIPGHGTPTVIIVGRAQAPVGDSVRAVLGVRGEPGRPAEAAKGLVWRSIVEHVDEPGWDDGWVTVADLPRRALATHPWSLSGGGAVQLLADIGAAGTRPLSRVTSEVGIMAVIGEEEAFELRPGSMEPAMPVVAGEQVRDLVMTASARFWPYDAKLQVRGEALSSRSMWPFRRVVEGYVMFGKTRSERGLAWLEYGMLATSKLRTPLSLAYAEIATHNHFVLDRGGKVFKQTAPVIKLPEGATEDQHLELLGVLNSSVTCFWLRQVCQSKASAFTPSGMMDQPWSWNFAFNGSNVADFPLPSTLPVDRGRLLDELAQQLARATPRAVAAAGAPTAEAMAAARQTYELVRSQMIAAQEELDWEVYGLYGLLTDGTTELTTNEPPPLALGERAFEIALARKVVAGEETTAWFARHGSMPITLLPGHWPTAYRGLVQRRLDVIEADVGIRLLEKPEHKRRWASVPWDKQQTAALRDWLLDRLEDKALWFDSRGRPAPQSVAQLADVIGRDAELAAVLTLWEGQRDVPVTASLVRLLAEEAVPYLAAYRYKDSGLRKRESWEVTWALQRREDAGEQVGPVAVPPKYVQADFRTVAYWKARGKLDVPKERFVLYPAAGRETDPTPLLGWAGWDHAQQALALNRVIADREADGWEDERLVPLIAGLAELQPWVEQWHAGLDASGVDLAAFLREELVTRASQVAWTVEQLGQWPPPPTGHGRLRGSSDVRGIP